MPDISKKVKALIESVRGKLTTTPSGRSVDQRRRGYQLIVKERQNAGEPVPTYEEWMATQDADVGGQ